VAFGVVVLTARLVGDKLQIKPVDGETASESTTVPENPSRLLPVIVEVPAVPARTVTLTGDGRILKSWTVRVMITECVSWPFVPVTFKV